jgi:acetyltransferase-like isoleucine patch superfamily enzyme
VIGRNVWIGPGCVIYGNITIGDCATVLPGSVVSMNVRPGAVVGGNPATVVYEHFDNSRLRRSLAADIDRASLETV